MKSLVFHKHYRSYNPGEVAGFEVEDAERIVNAGLASYRAEEQAPADSEKAEDHPPVDKMVKKSKKKMGESGE